MPGVRYLVALAILAQLEQRMHGGEPHEGVDRVGDPAPSANSQSELTDHKWRKADANRDQPKPRASPSARLDHR